MVSRLVAAFIAASFLALLPVAAPAKDLKVVVPEGTFVIVHLQDPMSSKDVHTGDVFQFVVSKDVVVDGYVVFRAGSKGVGHVTEAHSAGSHGKSGGIRLAFDNVFATDGTEIAVAHNQEAEEADRSTLGATALGVILTGGLGLFFHNFVHGSDVTIPTDKETNVLTIASRAIIVDSVKDKAEVPSTTAQPIPTATPMPTPTSNP